MTAKISATYSAYAICLKVNISMYNVMYVPCLKQHLANSMTSSLTKPTCTYSNRNIDSCVHIHDHNEDLLKIG